MMEFGKNNVIMGTYELNEYVVLKLLAKIGNWFYFIQNHPVGESKSLPEARGCVNGKAESGGMLID